MLKGETILSGAPDECSNCGEVLDFDVFHSGAGFYIGTRCQCGPYSRESGYFNSEEEAELMLKLPPEYWMRR